MLKKYRSCRFILIISICLFIISCVQVKTSDKSTIPLGRNSPITNEIKIPIGDEVKIEAKYLEPEKTIVTVTNISSSEVFIPYLPGIEDNFAPFAYFGLEKLNPKTGEFVEQKGEHTVPERHVLGSGKSFKYIIWVNKPGTYRIKVNYIIDKQLHSYLLSEDINLTSIELNKIVVSATKTITSSSIKL